MTVFLQDSLDLLLKKKCAHIGRHQYAAHAGKRDGKSMSGDQLWYEIEERRRNVGGYLVDAEKSLLSLISRDIEDYFAAGTSVIDLGPGTIYAFQNKVLPILKALRSRYYVPVDESIGFLKKLLNNAPKNVRILPAIDNFFENDAYYFGGDALICLFGSTISNIEHPISRALPEKSLVENLLHLSYAAKKGALLVTFDNSQDGEKIKAYYREHALFQMNVFFRMEAELQMKNFRPTAFKYEPEWIPESSQLAHVAVVTEDMDFHLEGHPISLKRGEKLHLKNSYKFTRPFFEKACELANLRFINRWENSSGAMAYLLEVPPVSCFLPATTTDDLPDGPAPVAHPQVDTAIAN